jgi:hypothetical protein
MTVSRSSRAAFVVGFAALFLLTGGAAGPPFVHAQSSAQESSAQESGDRSQPIGEPLRLGPPDTDGDANTDSNGEGRNAGAPANAGEPEPREAAAEGDSASGVEVDQLDEMSLETLGVLDTDSGALGADMWSGTPRRRVEALLPRVPGELDAPVLRDLARRLLLSPAVAPERRHAEGGSRDLLALRVDRLAAIGAIDGLMQLIDALPRGTSSPGVLRHRVTAHLLRHERVSACKAVRAAVRETDGAFWQKALALCQFADGEVAQADLTVRLLREQAEAEHAGFTALYDAASAGADRLPDGLPDALDPLQLGLILAGDLPFPDNRLTGLSAGALAALATAEDGPLTLRTRAAERAAALDALPVATLGQLYGQFTFAEDDLTTAASQIAERERDKLDPVRQRALLYQAVREEPAAAVRAELFRQLLTDRPPGAFIATARLLAQDLTRLEVQPDLAWFAATAGRALYAADRPEAAGRWLRMVQQEAIINPKAAAAVTALWPYAMLAGAEEVPANGGLAAWRQAQDGAGPAAAGGRESLLRALLGALGRAPERSWVEIALDAPATPQSAPPAALIYALQEAGEAGRRGETVLLSLLVLGPQGLNDCHPAALGTAVTALKRVGLEATARRLALQAAIYQGI